MVEISVNELTNMLKRIILKVEKIKDENKKLKNEIKYLEDLAKFKTESIRELQQQLKVKELEYEFLLNNFLDNFYTGLDEKYDSLEQELQEYKEIVEQQEKVIQKLYNRYKGNSLIKKTVPMTAKINEVNNENS